MHIVYIVDPGRIGFKLFSKISKKQEKFVSKTISFHFKNKKMKKTKAHQ